MFYNYYLSGGLLISDCVPDVHFLRKKRAFLTAKPEKKFSRWLILELNCKLSVHEINKITHGRLEIWNLFSQLRLI